MDWLKRLHGRLAERREHQTRSWDEDGLHADERGAQLHIGWAEVRQVYSYKKDCLAFDQVRLIFLSDHTGIEFSEDDPNFSGLCTFVSQKLGVPSDWFVNLISTPAFDTAFGTLYDAAAASSANPS